MSTRRGSSGPQYGLPLLLALPLLAWPVPAAAIVAPRRLLDASLVQAAATARAAEAVAEAAARAAFLAPEASAASTSLPLRASAGLRAFGAAPPRSSDGALQGAAPGRLQAREADSPPSDAEQWRRENDRLRHERAQLAEDVLRLRQQAALREAQWQLDRARLSQEDSDLRLEDSKLRREDSSLREALARTSEAGAARRRAASLVFGGSLSSQGLARSSRAAIIAVAVAALGCLCSLYCFGFGSCLCDDADEDSEDEETLRDLVDAPGHVTCMGCLRCFCRPYVFMCTCGTVFVSTIFALVLWEMGLLQPILSQLMVYAYIMGVVVLFVGMLAYEIWVLVARSVRVVLDKVNHPLAKARKKIMHQKHKYLDWCDDGEHNPVVGENGGRLGERERRNALWQASETKLQRNQRTDTFFR